MSVAGPEPLISHEEVVATMFMLADIAADVRVIPRLLEENGEEEEEQKEIVEQARREAENDPNIRRVRELAKRAQAELEARRRSDAPSNS